MFVLFVDCDCNGVGTVNYSRTCEKLGGQCSCVPNVITQTCSMCEYMYFGFDNDGCEGIKRA